MRRDATLVEREHAIGMGKDALEAVLGDDDGAAELAVDAAHRVEEVLGRDRVELARRLVEHEHVGLHRHNPREVEQLLLAAREFGDIAVQPILHAEVTCHLGHAQAQGRCLAADALQPEGKLGEDPVGDDLRIGILHDEADAPRLRLEAHLVEHDAVEQHRARTLAIGAEHALELAQQRRLSAAALSADAEVLAAFDVNAHVLERASVGIGIGEAQIADREQRHVIASFASIAVGTSTRST